ncbi:hypothetical protein HUT16_11715 [Kitasatospora sp. NA04385]|uniref:hypothetical protein n=1 Tax=Kitasatospora sp. NA04385 TaxID=2742135 RepID=UPI0015920BAC|nr:hypothetical protein [Kitasatospora sp. NA04385]QKW19642.1 hypothetical protein HUT16_11715 [Kitasatospora sp. NA04385]
MNVSHLGQATPPLRRLSELRGPAPQRSLDARALAALAANPGCRRRALLDAAGVDKIAIAQHLGRPAPFGQSPFAIRRGLLFESRLKRDGYAVLLEPLRRRLGVPDDELSSLAVPDLLPAASPAVRAERTAAVLAEAAADPAAWTLLDHPLLRLDVAGSPAYLEPDALVVHAGRCTVVEIKSFPVLDGSADPANVGAAARQAAVYVLALQEAAARRAGLPPSGDPYAVQELPGAPELTVLLVCPKDFSTRPVAVPVDVRRELAVTRRQLSRMTRIEQLLEALPEGVTFDLARDASGAPTRPAGELAEAVAAVPAAYAPECISTCELGFHCRSQARCAGAVEQLGRGVRGELGSLRTVEEALAAAGRGGEEGLEPELEGGLGLDEASERLAYAARLRAEALASAGGAR